MLTVDVRHALDGTLLDAALGAEGASVTAIFGPSGAGKTSLIQIVAGLVRPDDGRVVIEGETVTDIDRGIHRPARARRVGYVFQDGRLFPHLRVTDNLMFGARRARGRPTLDFDDVVELLGLRSLLDRRPARLSGGERQRVALGRALLSAPRLLLLDEPLAALDQARKAEILPFLLKVRDEASCPILYVSHSIDEVTRLADQMIVLEGGKVRARGTVPDLMGRLDLFPLTGRFEAGGVIEARVVAHDHEDGLTELHFEGGRLFVPAVAEPLGTMVRARIRARDVLLARDPNLLTSANNTLLARTADIREDPGAYVDVQLAIGAATLIARITGRSLRRLDLAVGQDVVALVKSVSVDSRMVRVRL